MDGLSCDNGIVRSRRLGTLEKTACGLSSIGKRMALDKRVDATMTDIPDSIHISEDGGQRRGLTGNPTRDLSHPKRESYH